MEHFFDDLARGTVQRRLSRRQVMAGVGGALGAALVPLSASDAWGQTETCRQFCERNFRPGDARRRCIRGAHNHHGPCYECGPKASDPSRVSCHGTCCQPGEKCENNKCVPTDGGNQPCETFICGFGACAERPNATPSGCFCFEVVGGTSGVCLQNFFCQGTTPCPNGQADCPTGETCVTNTCCGSGVQLCAPACPPENASAQLTLLSQFGGPTAGSR